MESIAKIAGSMPPHRDGADANVFAVFEELPDGATL
jgi:hypothetical protein